MSFRKTSYKQTLQVDKRVLFLSIAAVPTAHGSRRGGPVSGAAPVGITLFRILEHRRQIPGSTVRCRQEPLGVGLGLQKRITPGYGRCPERSRRHQRREGGFYGKGRRGSRNAGEETKKATFSWIVALRSGLSTILTSWPGADRRRRRRRAWPPSLGPRHRGIAGAAARPPFGGGSGRLWKRRRGKLRFRNYGYFFVKNHLKLTNGLFVHVIPTFGIPVLFSSAQVD